LLEGQNINIISPCASAGEERDTAWSPMFPTSQNFLEVWLCCVWILRLVRN